MRIWLLTDGKAGDIQPCLGIAEQISEIWAAPVQIEQRIVTPRIPWVWAMPWGPIDPKDQPKHANSPLKAPYPDIAIASGRRSVPYLKALKRFSPQCFCVFLKHPRARFSTADLIWAPSHDRLRGANVLTTPTGPHRISQKILHTHRHNAPEFLTILPEPRMAVLLGGPSKQTQYRQKDFLNLQEQLKKMAPFVGSFMVVASRRTPSHWVGEIQSALCNYPGIFWRPQCDNPNPYLDVLSLADGLLVTGDSHNMVSEALAVGRSVCIFLPQKLSPKLRRFVDELLTAGFISIFHDFDHKGLEFRPQAPIDSTYTISKEILNRLIERQHAS